MGSDRPLETADNDRLGFGDLAKRLVQSLSGHAVQQGFVLGIVGAWGSGKSSLLNLTRLQLAQSEPAARPTVIDFQPWTIGNRDALLANLFRELAGGIDKYRIAQGDLSEERKARASEIAEGLRKFAKTIAPFGDLVELASKIPTLSALEWIARGIKAAQGIGKEKGPGPSLVELKAKLTIDLRDLNHRFVVTIDDVDRLEPSEVVEVMRLIRAVADFPNVVYILCYDPSILKLSIEKELRVGDGDAFLEKIIQLTVTLPEPEPFCLRQWFADELTSIATPKSDAELQRLKSVIDAEGGLRFKTARDVVRSLDAIRFVWPSLEDQCDLSDFVWLSLIKNGNINLYRWIEMYSAVVSSMSLGIATVDQNEQAKDLSDLMSAVGNRDLSNNACRALYSEHLPGVEASYQDETSPLTIYCEVGEKSRMEAIRDKRLASPDHYRLYFALSAPSHAITQFNLDRFWASINSDPPTTAELLLEWHHDLVGANLSRTEMLLDRLTGNVTNVFSTQAANDMVRAFGEMLDEGYLARPFGRFAFNSLWDRATRLLKLLQPVMDPREGVIVELFRTGRAIGWLTRIFRDEIFAHGAYGYRPKPESEWLLSADDFGKISAHLIDRYRTMTLADILSAPESVQIIYAWMQGGGGDEPKGLISRYADDNSNLVGILEAFISTSTSSVRGIYKVLHRRDLERFFAYDTVRDKLALISSGEPLALADRAKTLLKALDDGQDD